MNLALAFAQAQRQIALATGMAPTAAGNCTVAGVPKTGVLNLVSAEMPLVSGGMERVERLEIVLTADQFSAKPVTAPRLAVVAYNRNWWCTAVGESGIHYFLTCVPA